MNPLAVKVGLGALKLWWRRRKAKKMKEQSVENVLETSKGNIIAGVVRIGDQVQHYRMDMETEIDREGVRSAFLDTGVMVGMSMFGAEKGLDNGIEVNQS